MKKFLDASLKTCDIASQTLFDSFLDTVLPATIVKPMAFQPHARQGHDMLQVQKVSSKGMLNPLDDCMEEDKQDGFADAEQSIDFPEETVVRREPEQGTTPGQPLLSDPLYESSTDFLPSAEELK